MASNCTESEQFYFKKEDLLVNCVPVLQGIRSNKKLCDIEIKVRDQIISAHKIILAATIPYFYNMFCADSQESWKKMEIVMQEFDPDVIEALVNYSYSGEIKMRVENIENLMVCANLFELPNVRDECIKFMISNLNANNVFAFKRIADNNKVEELTITAENFICKNFVEASSSQDFLELDSRDLVKIIESADLKVPSEERVYEAAMNWIKHNQEERRSMLPEVLSKIHLSLLPPEYLVNVVSKEEIIRKSSECLKILDETKNAQLLLLKNYWSLKPLNISPRLYENEVIYLLCGSNAANEIKNSMLVYKENQWIEVTRMPKEKKWFDSVLLDDKIYVIGGLIGEKISASIETFDLLRNKWSTVGNLNENNNPTGVASLKDCIYCFHGHGSTNSVKCFSEAKNEWRRVASLNQQRGLLATVSANDYIYVLGGGSDNTKSFKTCERFCPTANKWTFIKSMETVRYGLGGATLNGKIYACGGQDSKDKYLSSCEVYDPQNDSWTFIASMQRERSNFPLAACNGKLYAIGGHDKEGEMSSVEEYCPQKNEWKFVTPLPDKICDARAVVMSR